MFILKQLLFVLFCFSPTISGLEISSGRWLMYTVTFHWRKLIFLSRRCQFKIPSWSKVGICIYCRFSRLRFYLACRSYNCCQSLKVHMCNSLVRSGKCSLLEVTAHLWLSWPSLKLPHYHRQHLLYCTFLTKMQGFSFLHDILQPYYNFVLVFFFFSTIAILTTVRGYPVVDIFIIFLMFCQ